MDGITAPTPPEAVPTRELQDEVRVLIEAALNANSLVQRDALWHRVEDFCRTLASSLAREAALQQELIVVGQASVEAHGEDLEKLRAENTALREAMECWQSYSSHQEWCRACAEDSVGSCTEGVALKNSALLASPSDPTEGQTNG